MTLFAALRELRGPVGALAALMLVINVALAGNLMLTVDTGTGSITLVTCLNSHQGFGSDDGTADGVSHDCGSCCVVPHKPLSTAGQGPVAAAPVVFVAYRIVAPAIIEPAHVLSDRSAPIRAPPFFS